jgi:hypothetical protein
MIVGGIMIDIEMEMPCSVLVSRVQLDKDEMFSASEDFAHVFYIHSFYGINQGSNE